LKIVNEWLQKRILLFFFLLIWFEKIVLIKMAKFKNKKFLTPSSRYGEISADSPVDCHRCSILQVERMD